MDFNVSKNTYFCQSFPLKVLLISLSLKALIKERIGFALQKLDCNSVLRLEKELVIPVSKLNHVSGIVYRCAIAFVLSPSQQLSPLVLAEQIFTVLQKFPTQSREKPYLDFMVQLTPTGWLEFHLSDTALAVWLQQLPFAQDFGRWNNRKIENNIAKNPQKPNFLPMQYAHARCCSLLRLADQEGLIELTNLDFSQPTWHWQQPEPIPYLDGTRLRLGQPSEQKLIAQLLRVIEAQLDEQPLDTAKLAYHLSQAFLEFERYCRIWGEVKQDHLALAQARLGLIALTQLLLKKLLEKLCIPSPAGL